MTITVQHCCQAADLALKLGQTEDTVTLSQHVLAHHRYHLRAQLLLGQALMEQQKWPEALQRLRLVLGADPECAEAYSGLGIIALAQEDIAGAVRDLARAFENAPESEEAREALQQALTRQAGHPTPPPAFTPACVGRFYQRRGLPQLAADAYATAFQNTPGRDDLRLAYATALWQAGAPEQAVDLCRPLLRRTPRPLTALLITAADYFRRGRDEEGLRLLNEARAWDPDDVRAHAILGEAADLPPTPAPASTPEPVDPALGQLLELAGQIGNPSLPPANSSSGELVSYAQGVVSQAKGRLAPATPPPVPSDPDLRRFQRIMQDVEYRLFGGEAPPTGLPPAPDPHGRQPAEVLLAWEEGLRNRFGAEGAAQIDRALQDMVQASTGQGVASRVVYLDRPPYPELPRPDPHDAQQIKSFLDELDRRLGEEGLDFHYLSIIGGDELLPLARLPNPSEDTDEEVPSDNLYASRDPTYLIPERATGRLPDDGTDNAAAMTGQLARCAAHRRGVGRLTSSTSGCLGALLSWLGALAPGQPKVARRFGLSAQVWAQASEQVFNTLPGTDPLHLCPPTNREAIVPAWLADVPMAYFNLHGAADSPNWYGQRDMSMPGEGPLMPVAFSPLQIPAGRIGGMAIYSEACYGANILGKTAETSIALRFLAEGALGVVGSTVVSYGVSVPPLTDADLLGQFFWQRLLRGECLGEALLQAKLDFTREMYRRQGYLDGDDMKTLLEFVLYGDPLASGGALPSTAEVHNAVEEVPTPPVLCGKHTKTVALHHLSGELVARVRRSMSWLQQGEEVGNVEVSLRSGCPGDQCRGHCHADPSQETPEPEALVFTTHREAQTEDGTCIPQWARVVVNPRGRIVKMAVTR